MGLPKTDDPAGSLIRDGGFETGVTGGGLAWRFGEHKSPVIGYDHYVMHSGLPALRLDFDQKNITCFIGVCQLVVVEPKTSLQLGSAPKTRSSRGRRPQPHLVARLS